MVLINGRMRSTGDRSEEISKGALLFFNEKTGVQSCTVRDVTNLGAGVRTQDLKIVPPDFALSFDNFRTVRMWTDLAPRRLYRRGLQKLTAVEGNLDRLG
jgi:hypothetical protein